MKSVLIVDDDQPTQQLLAALMRRNGFGSVIAANGAEAVKALAAADFAIIILDLMMPEVDGQAVIEYVARERENTPVIVCTAAGPRRTDAIDSKVVKAIVRKPFDIDHLSKLVAELTS
ncbi:MAG: response regulator [Thermoanaerobaculia bacterium]